MEFEVIDIAEARARRAAILKSLHMNEGDMRERYENYRLTLEERARAEEFEGLGFLVEAAAKGPRAAAL